MPSLADRKGHYVHVDRIWRQDYQRAEGREMANTNPHKSEYPIGHVIDCERGRRTYSAQLHARVPNGEEWRVYVKSDLTGYIYSVGFAWVQEHRSSARRAESETKS